MTVEKLEARRTCGECQAGAVVGGRGGGARVWARRAVWGLALVAAALLLAAVAPVALGLINPRYTPADLVRGSTGILLLTVSAPQNGAVQAEIVETLKGNPLPAKKLVLDWRDAANLTEDEVKDAFGPQPTATALLLTAAPQEGDEKGALSGCLQVGTRWFSVSCKQDRWCLDHDDKVLGAVWAGSARMLGEAARYVEADPTASFPVRSDLSWGSDQNPGKVVGRASGCLLAGLGAPLGDCVVVLSDGGDRVYQMDAKGGSLTDSTARLKLTTSSKLAAIGDFNGDGRLDLASWDGQGLQLALQSAEGTFAVRTGLAGLAGCLSLEAVNVGVKSGAGLLAGTPGGPVLLTPDDKGGFTPALLADAAAQQAGEDLKPGGFCVTADFDGDGRCDVMQLFSGGILFYKGEAPGRFKAPVITKLALVRNPHTAVCGDYDADGCLDLVVGGDDGAALLSHSESRLLENNTRVTGELDYHGNQNRPGVLALGACDVNNDGRQGVVFFYPERKPMVFFNRGFACFGWARELDIANEAAATEPGVIPPPGPAAPALKAAEVLQQGQAAGVMWDLNGDGAQDLLGVAPDGAVWVLFGAAGDRACLGLTLALSPKALDPLTVTVSDSKRRLGAYVVRPGLPVFIGRLVKGPLTLEWLGPDGKPRTRKVIVLNPTRVELDPASGMEGAAK